MRSLQLVIFILGSWSSQVFASHNLIECPDLRGTYKCPPDNFHSIYHDRSVNFEQFTFDDLTTYYHHLLPSNITEFDGARTLVADGKLRASNKRNDNPLVIEVISCNNGKVVQEITHIYGRDTFPGVYRWIHSFSSSEDKSALLWEEVRSGDFDQSTRLKNKTTCLRVATPE